MDAPDALRAIPHDGGLSSRGMPKFDELTDDQIKDIVMALRANARDALRGREMRHQRISQRTLRRHRGRTNGIGGHLQHHIGKTEATYFVSRYSLTRKILPSFSVNRRW